MNYILEILNEYDKKVIEELKTFLIENTIENHEKIIEKLKYILNGLQTNLNNEIMDLRLDILEETSHYLEYLPKDLLCFYGDFLVKSVALKQRVSDDIDSVSIETDICIMTKSQGFKWIKIDKEYLYTCNM